MGVIALNVLGLPVGVVVEQLADSRKPHGPLTTGLIAGAPKTSRTLDDRRQRCTR